MSELHEYRVRPVQRFVVTHWHSKTNADGTNSGGCESVGEFASLAQATMVMQALQGGAGVSLEPPGQEFVVVSSALGDLASAVFYAYSEVEATERKAQAEAEMGGEFRVYSRPYKVPEQPPQPV